MVVLSEYDWHPRFLLLGRVGGRWVFWRWVMARTDYFRPEFEERRLAQDAANPAST